MPAKGIDYAVMMRAAIVEENRRKVQRQKEEKLFVKGLQSHYQLSHLATIREELSNRPHHDDGKFSSRPQTPSPPRDDPTRCVATFDAKVRCFEVTQGGASLWTGESDGSIGIRNGATGDIAYQLSPVQQTGISVLVDSLFSTGNNMFVGCSDGSIRVYDVLVFVLAFESTEHGASVCGFAATFDQRTFSVSVDGSVVKWDTDANNFTLIAKAKQEVPLRCIASYGYHVFVGTDEGPIFAMDTDTLDLVRTYNGHQSNVTCLVVQDGYLFSGSNDTSVFVWNIGTGEAIKTLLGHQAGVSSFFCDAVAHHLWSVDLRGTMNVWSTVDEECFPLVQTCAPDDDTEVFALKGITVLDAAKVWTLGSNGVNKVWHASVNRVEEGIRSAINTMQGIIEQDEVELAKWDDLTKTLQQLAARMNQRIGVAMESHSFQLVLLRHFADWLRFTKKRRIVTMQRQLATSMEEQVTECRRRDAMRAWCVFATNAMRTKRNVAVANLLRSQFDQRLLSIYARKLHEKYLSERRRERANRKTALLSQSTNNLIMRRVLRVLENNRLLKQGNRKLLDIARVLEVLSSRRILCRFFFDWCLHSNGARKKRFQISSIQSICTMSTNRIMNSCWGRWSDHVATRTKRKAQRNALSSICSRSSSMLVTRVFREWMRFSMERHHHSLVEKQSSHQMHITSLNSTLQSMDHLLQRRSLLDEADVLIHRAMLQRDSKRATVMKLRGDIDVLKDDLERKKSRAPQVVDKTLQEQVADLLSLLKCRLLNFFADFVQMQRVAEKTRRVGAHKVFLEAHQAVKRVVVEMTKEGYLPTDKPWPLTDKMISSMKNHHTEVVLGAIKTMIMAYDALNVEQRSSLTSDEEVVVNAQNLHLLADRCLAAREKRLRH
jgi:WD40 repeat protein